MTRQPVTTDAPKRSRHARRKAKVARDATKLTNLISAAIAERNASIIARNVGQLRNGVKFDTSGTLAPRAYKYDGASSEAARVGSNIAGTKEVSLNDKQTAKFVATVRNKAFA